MSLIMCTFCGNRFDPEQNPGCNSCPLNQGCSLVCCPNCGYKMVDVQQSKMANIFTKLLSKTKTSPPESK